MARRGELTLGMIIGTVLALVVLAILIYLASKSSRGFLDSLTCSEDDGSGLRQMARAEGCKEEQGLEPYTMGFFTDAGKVCCEEIGFVGQGDGTTFGGAGASATYTLSDTKTGKALVEGQTVQIYASGATASTHDLKVNGAATCAMQKNVPDPNCNAFAVKETVLTRTGLDVTDQVLDGRLPASITADAKGMAKITGDIKLKQVPTLIDEPLKYTLTISDPKTNTPVDTYTLNIKMTTPVRYAGVTQQWSKRKEITAACDSPVTCDRILFRVQKSDVPMTACDTVSTAELIGAKELQVSYCLVKDGKIQTSCGKTYDACTQLMFSQTNTEYAGLQQTLMAGVRQGLIPPDVASQFSTVQGQTSTYSCIKTVDTANSNGVYFVPTDPTTGRASFTLEHQAFENGNLCIYGHDKTTPLTSTGSAQPIYYTGKGPVKLMLDVTPPTAILDFRPGSLQLRYGCTDNEGGSGCKEGFGIAYIAQVAQFLRAIAAKDTPQNAAAWCPAYGTAAGYRAETRPITQYNDNEVRVLCLRVEDQAGNAGVAMATVYNAYDLAVQALALALQEAND